MFQSGLFVSCTVHILSPNHDGISSPPPFHCPVMGNMPSPIK